MHTLLIQNTLMKQIRDYDYRPDFHNLASATILKS